MVERKAGAEVDGQLITEQQLYGGNGGVGIVSHPSAVVISRESEDYGQGITNSAQSGSSNVSRTANASRKDCCLNFFRNGFRRHPSCMPSASDVRVSTSLETKKQNGCH